MDDAIYLTDSYVKEFDAEIESVKDGKFVILSKTAFYPNGGGQPYDTGTIICNKQRHPVTFVGKFDGHISHEVAGEGLKVGDKIKGMIDWERRYALMKCHTAAHIISEVIHQQTGALITGNQLDVKKCRIDFALDDFNVDKMKSYVNQANDIASKNLPVKISFLSREEADKIPVLSKLSKGLPDSITFVRIVDIGGFDLQADGGTHVHSTKEIGNITFLRCENKGKNNRRLYFSLVKNHQ